LTVRVAILTVGSRGDVQPLVAFGVGLRNAGHEVVLATHPRHAPLVFRHGLEFAPLAEGQVSRGLDTEQGRRWIEEGSRRLPAAVGLIRDARSVARQRLSDAVRACEDADAIVAFNLTIVLGWQVAELLGIPLVRATNEPPVQVMTPRAARLAPLAWQTGWLAARPWLNAVRRDAVGAGPLPLREPFAALNRRGELALLAFSPEVLPPPASLGGAFELTGYWFLEGTDDPAPSPALLDFLAAGPPPVAVGFGTMIDTDPAASIRLVSDALERAGQRGVLVARTDDVGLPPHLCAVERIDHSWLFTRCSAAVHHSAVGTVATTLRAGIPIVPVPHMIHQFFWARRVTELGVGPPAIRRSRLTAERLAEAIHIATTCEEMRRRAAALAERIRSEDGVARGVEAFERRVCASRPSQISAVTSAT
jgi:sterol 3beta-glucosyltransferase